VAVIQLEAGSSLFTENRFVFYQTNYVGTLDVESLFDLHVALLTGSPMHLRFMFALATIGLVAGCSSTSNQNAPLAEVPEVGSVSVIVEFGTRPTALLPPADGDGLPDTRTLSGS
jgi:hypothetical protein